MKNVIMNLVLLLSFSGMAAAYSWRDVEVSPNGVWEPSLKGYIFSGQIYGDMPYTSIGGTEAYFVGYKDEDGFHLKQGDRMATEMPVENNVWVLAVYGDILYHDTIWNAEQIGMSSIYDYSATGGTQIENPENFYLGFMGRGYGIYSDLTWFGWLHLSVNDNLEISILDKGIGLNGEPVRVGGGPIPEPSCGLLLLLGGVALGLRRKQVLGL